jgi:ribosomal protein S12 methylthiotransferase
MGIQAEISRARLKALVGTTHDVLVDGRDEDEPMVMVGRLQSQAPDVDGRVFLDEVPEGTAPGRILRVRIRRSSVYDLVGRYEARIRGGSAS